MKSNPLLALERLQQLELDQAHVERGRAEKQLQEGRARLDELQSGLDDAGALERRLLTGAGGTSVDHLRHTRLYVQTRVQDLQLQRHVVAKAEAAVASAQQVVTDKFARLSATQRLRERRAADQAAQRLRDQFWKLDELAIVKRSGP